MYYTIPQRLDRLRHLVERERSRDRRVTHRPQRSVPTRPKKKLALIEALTQEVRRINSEIAGLMRQRAMLEKLIAMYENG